jgi:outer membrane biogenesis lipoprotein LolB
MPECRTTFSAMPALNPYSKNHEFEAYSWFFFVRVRLILINSLTKKSYYSELP